MLQQIQNGDRRAIFAAPLGKDVFETLVHPEAPALDEIQQQPEALERTFAAEIEHFQAFRKRMQRQPPSLVVLAARGTSDNAALFTRYLIETFTGVPWG